MAREPDSDAKDIVAHEGPEDDDAFLRRLKLVRDVEQHRPFPIRAAKEWLETMLVSTSVLICLYALFQFFRALAEVVDVG